MASIDEMSANLSFTTAKTGADRTVTSYPNPNGERKYTSSRSTTTSSNHRHLRRAVPQKFADRVPRVVDTDDGVRPGSTTGSRCPNVASTGRRRPVSEYGSSRPGSTKCGAGAWDIHARVKDMDLNGVYASLNFPSFLRVRGPAAATVTTDRDSRDGLRQGMERLAHRGMAGRLPRPRSFLVSCRGCSTPRSAAKMIHENPSADSTP